MEGDPRADKVGTITDGPEGEYIVDRQATEAVKFIAASKDGPFFLNLWCYGVHGPWGHKEEYTKAFMAKKDPTRHARAIPSWPRCSRAWTSALAASSTNWTKQGIADNTIIIFNSDNGGNTHSNVAAKAGEEGRRALDWQKWAGNQPPTMNTPLRDGKGTLYEGGTRVPLMWSWAGRIEPGSTSEAVVGPIDVYPTVLDLLGIAKPDKQHFDGVSYAKVLKGEGALDRAAYFNYSPARWSEQGRRRVGRAAATSNCCAGLAIRTRTSSTTFATTSARPTTSPPKMPDKVKELDALIDGFLKDTGADYPRPNPAFETAKAKGKAR